MNEPVPLPDRISGFRSEVINGIIAYLESLRPVTGAGVSHEWSPRGLKTSARSTAGVGAFDWWQVPFGYKVANPITPAVVTIAPGELSLGTQTPAATVQTDVTIVADNSYVWCEYTYATGAFVIASPSATFPGSTPAVFRAWLWKFRLISGHASRPALPGYIGNMGNIHLRT